jgi:hypothetical protein
MSVVVMIVGYSQSCTSLWSFHGQLFFILVGVFQLWNSAIQTSCSVPECLRVLDSSLGFYRKGNSA